MEACIFTEIFLDINTIDGSWTQVFLEEICQVFYQGYHQEN